MARNLAQLVKDADEEDPLENPIPKGLMDDFGAPTPPAAPSDDEDMPAESPVAAAAAAAPAPSAVPEQSETQKLIASFSPTRGTPPPPRDSKVPALAEAQRNQARSRNMGDVSDALYAAFTRRPVGKASPSTLGDDAQSQIALADHETQVAKGEDELSANRAVLSKVMGQDLSGMSMAGISALSAQLGLDKKLAARKTGANQTPEKTELIKAQTQALQDRHGAIPEKAAELEAVRKQLGEELHMDLSGMSEVGIKTLLAKRQMDQRAKEHAGVAATAAEQAEIRRQRLGLSKDKFGMAKDQATPFGFDTEKPMQTGQAKELTESAKTREMIHQKTQAMRELVKDGVPWTPGSTKAARLNMLWTEVQPLLTSNSGMGSFTEGHRGLFADAAGNPVSLTNVLNPGRLPALLDEIDKSATESTKAMAASLGAHEKPKGHAAPPSAPSQVATPGGVRAVAKRTLPDGSVQVKYSDGTVKTLSGKDL